MAISHVQPLLFLLASLFCLPALRAVDFHYCNDIGYSYGNITRVEISPDDNPTVTIFGYASDEAQTIYVGSITVGVKFEGNDRIFALKRYKLYELCPGPIEPGTNFNFTLSDIPWIKPWNGKYALTLTNDYDASGEPVAKMCVFLDLPAAPAVDSA